MRHSEAVKRSQEARVTPAVDRAFRVPAEQCDPSRQGIVGSAQLVIHRTPLREMRNRFWRNHRRDTVRTARGANAGP
jgi:hypothetical protein